MLLALPAPSKRRDAIHRRRIEAAQLLNPHLRQIIVHSRHVPGNVAPRPVYRPRPNPQVHAYVTGAHDQEPYLVCASWERPDGGRTMAQGIFPARDESC